MPSELDQKKLPAELAALIFAVTFPTVLTWAYFIWLAKAPAAVQQSVYSAGKAIQFGFPVLWVGWVQRQCLAWPTPRREGLLIGGLLGLAVVCGTIAAYHGWLKPSGTFDSAALAVREKVADFGIDSDLKYAAFSAFYAVCHSLLEEYYWRWFVFGQLARITSFGRAIAISSLGFMAHHVLVLSHYFGWGTFLSLFLSLAVAVGGVAWAWLYHRSRSLYGPWLSHALVDAGIFLVGFEIVKTAW